MTFKRLLSISTFVSMMSCTSSAVVFAVPTAPTKDISSSVSREVSNYFDGVETRYIKDQLTPADKAVLHTLYGGMIMYGAVFAPEASSILSHYLYGDGSDLELSPNYIRNSPVIRKQIKKVGNRPGVYRNTFVQTEDKRLSYAYNPYHLKIKRNKDGTTTYKIFEKIVFHNPKKSKGYKTNFWVGNLKFSISDQLVYAAGKCKPFVAYAEWTE